MTAKRFDTDGRNRLPELLGEIKNLSEFSRVSGVNRRMLDRYKAGTEPTIGVAHRIAKALGVPMDALVSDQNVSNQVQPVSDSDVVLIPLLDVSASAGPGLINERPSEIAKVPFSRQLLRRLGVSPADAQFITGRGDSMFPTIADGQIVLVDVSKRKARDDGIYVVVIGDDVRLKRIQRGFDGSLTLLSDNSEMYKEERLSPADADALLVAGKVFWKLGDGL